MSQPPFDDTIIVAIAGLVDDQRNSGAARMPSHSDIEHEIRRAGLAEYDAGKQSTQPIGKFKRVHRTLVAVLDSKPEAAAKFCVQLLAAVRGHGGFRPGSANFCGSEVIENLTRAYAAHGWHLAADGSLTPTVLQSLGGREATAQLRRYAERARSGAMDSPLLAGVAKDLLEATAIHVCIERYGAPPSTHVFPAILGMAFEGLGLASEQTPKLPGEHVRKRVERAAYELGCAISAMRNKEGTGHGRPWISTITAAEARFAVESMGNIAALLLDTLAPRAP